MKSPIFCTFAINLFSSRDRYMTRLKLTLILLCFMTMIQASNPFFEKYSTPHGTVPFNLIKTEHYAPAIHEGIRRQNAEIDAIINNPAAPTFENTIVPTRSPENCCIVSLPYSAICSAPIPAMNCRNLPGKSCH